MDRPIGLLDSGVGGLTVANELMRQLPKEELVYIGDTLRCPYGPRNKTEVRQFTNQLVNFLLEKDVKMIVIACNTATAFALDDLQKKLSIPIIGVIQPGARAAIKQSKTKEIGVIGTEGTISSEAYEKALKLLKNDIVTTSQACSPFVPLVESGEVEGENVESIVNEYLSKIKFNDEIDTLILGCTHYPLLKETIQKVVGNDVQLISSGEETAREVSAILSMNNELNKGEHKLKHEFFATGDVDKFEEIAKMIFNNYETEEYFISFKNIKIDKYKKDV